MKKVILISALWVVLAVALTACNSGLIPTGSQGNDAMATAVQQTVEVRLTQGALSTVIAKPTEIHVVPTATQPAVVQPTNTVPAPTVTNTPAPTATAKPTDIPVPCNLAQYISDVTVKDGTSFAAGTAFTKTWRIKNIGTCNWTKDYEIIFVSGDSMGGAAVTKLNREVKVGETVDISINLAAPSTAKDYKGYWQLRSDKGVVFGTGNGGRLWVSIKVTGDPANGQINLKDLTISYCSLIWSGSNGGISCPVASYDFKNGSVFRDTAPKLETGEVDNESAIIAIPADGNGGYISGKIGQFVINDKDHFYAVTGCMYGYDKCSVTFRLDYSADGGALQTMKSWTQTYDKSVESVDIDLSSLKGKTVVFYLVVTNNNNSSEGDVAFWLKPRFLNVP